MAVLSSILFVSALAAAVTIGPQTRPWTWGPALSLLALSLFAALPALSKSRRVLPPVVSIAGGMTFLWFAFRMVTSPVVEFALTDFLLMLAAGAAVLVVKAITENAVTERIFLCGLAALVIASVFVLAKQVADPAYSPIFSFRPATLPSGFFGHYNEGANFLIGSSLILAGAALVARHPGWMRILWGIAAASGIVGVYFTRSRGGILAIAVGLAAFSLILLISVRKSRWKAPLAIGLPFISMLIGGFLWKGWEAAQQMRYNASADTVLENPIRISLLEIAAQCIGLMPWSGSGSRSFAWNCYRFWEVESHGGLSARPELVHNEILQSATDYGLIGATLLVFFLATAVILILIRLVADQQQSGGASLAVGGVAGLIGMMVQSSFSFVFHLLPGVLLLGITIGMLLWPVYRPAGPIAAPKPLHGWLRMACAGIAALLCLISGIQTTRMLIPLWPVYIVTDSGLLPSGKTRALHEATLIFQSPTLFKEQGIAHQAISAAGDPEAVEDRNLAIDAYKKALEKNPFDITVSINLAPLLAIAGRTDEAETEYRRIISIQGGAESLFRGHSRMAEHLLQKGIDQIGAGNPMQALGFLQAGIDQTNEIRKQAPWLMPATIEGLKLDVDLHANMAVAFEAAGDIEKALEYYELASKIQTGERMHYPLALLLGNIAKSAWQERRPSEALRDFIKARDHARKTEILPPGVTARQRSEYLSYLDDTIEYLTDAGVQPLPTSEK